MLGIRFQLYNITYSFLLRKCIIKVTFCIEFMGMGITNSDSKDTKSNNCLLIYANEDITLSKLPRIVTVGGLGKKH